MHPCNRVIVPNSALSEQLMGANFVDTLKGRLDELSAHFNRDIESITSESLIDAFIALFTDCKAVATQNEYISNFVLKYDGTVQKLKKLRVGLQDFEIVTTLATGAVGEVSLVKGKKDSNIYAMKTLKKMDLLTRREAAFFMEERDALVLTRNSEWITSLYAAFQDDDNLYLVMEYAPGGSMRSLIQNRDEPMPENEAKFYIAEILLSLEQLHKMKYIHRDVKPDNCLLDEKGHIKLADFGSCTKIDDTKRMQSNETVGTPDYISPEILKAHEGNSSYGAECDFWSLGIMLFELLTDELPFYSESLVETYGRIMNHQKYFEIPDELELSEEVKDLLKKLICDRTKRIGLGGSQEIKSHPWFKDLDWTNVRTSNPPFVPTLNGPEDTRYFDDEDERKQLPPGKVIQKGKEFNGKSLPFIGYSYVKNATPFITWGLNSSNLLTDSINSSTQDKIVKDVLKSEGLELEDLKKSMKILREEKERIDIELGKQKTQKEQIKKEKEELEIKVSKLKLSLEKEMGITAELKHAVSQHKTLELQVSQLKTNLENEKLKFKEAEIKVNEITKQRGSLEVDIITLQKQLGAQNDSQGSSQRTIMELNEKLDDLKDELKTLHSENENLEDQRRTLDSELIAITHDFELSKKKLSLMDEINSKLEKEKTSMNVDIEDLKRKIIELSGERESLLKAIAVSESKASVEDVSNSMQTNIDALKQEINDLLAQKSKVNDELTAITKEKAMWEFDLQEAAKKLKNEQDAHDETKSKLVSFGSKFSTMANQVKQMEDMKSKFESATLIAKADAESIALKLKEESKNREELESKAADTEKQFELLRKDFEQLHVKLDHLTVDLSYKEGKLLDLDTIVLAEKNLREQLEEQKATAATINAELQLEISRLAEKIQGLVQEQTETTQSYENQIAFLKDKQVINSTNTEEYEMKIATIEKQLHDKTSQQEDLTHEYNTLSMMYSRVQQEFVDFKHAIATNPVSPPINKRESRDFGEIHSSLDSEPQVTSHDSFRHRSSRDSSKRADNSKNSTDRKESKDFGEMLGSLLASDESSITTSLERENTSKTSKSALKPRRSINFLTKFKSKSKQDQDNALKKLDELEELGSRDRNLSHFSNLSLGRNSIFSSHPRLETEYNFNLGMQGAIRIPKGGKVRKGWVQKHGIIRDYKILIYDREKDVDIVDGTLLADLTCEIVYVRHVSQAELIHASFKEIDSIFKIQIIKFDLQNGTEPLVSPASAKITNEIARLREKVKTFAINMSGIEKMMSVASENHRSVLRIKYEDDSMQLTRSVEELAQLEAIHGDEALNFEEDVPSQENQEFSEEVELQVYRIEQEIESSLQVKEELKKSRGPSKRIGNSSESLSAADDEIDKTVKRLREELAILKSADKSIIIPLLEKLNEGAKITKINGHVFRLKKNLYKTKDCAACHESIWNGNAYECQTCKLACHKSCILNVELTCHQGCMMRPEEPLFIMAKDMADRNKWIAGIDFFRKEYVKMNNLPEFATTNPPPPPSASQRQPTQLKKTLTKMRRF